MLPVWSAINAIASANVHPKFYHPFASWLPVSEVALFDLQQSGSDARLRLLIPKMLHPFLKRGSTGLILVLNDLVHIRSVA